MSDKNPWKTLSTKIIYKNKWMRLREDQVITLSGTKGIYGVIEAFPALGIVPLTDNLETYLVGQYRYTIDAYSWEIPEGGGNPGESHLETAKRELLEETGLKAKKWKYLESLYTSNSFTNEIDHIFLAEELVAGEAQPEHTEDLQIKKIDFLDAYQLVLDASIKDSISIIGILRTYHYLKNMNKI